LNPLGSRHVFGRDRGRHRIEAAFLQESLPQGERERRKSSAEQRFKLGACHWLVRHGSGC
jgi:hypothetical protein